MHIVLNALQLEKAIQFRQCIRKEQLPEAFSVVVENQEVGMRADIMSEHETGLGPVVVFVEPIQSGSVFAYDPQKRDVCARLLQKSFVDLEVGAPRAFEYCMCDGT